MAAASARAKRASSTPRRWPRPPLKTLQIAALLDVSGPQVKSAFDRLKKSARRASWSHFKEQVAHLAWVDSLGETDAWLEGIAPSKVADFAEAGAADAGVMRDYADTKRIALAGVSAAQRARQGAR